MVTRPADWIENIWDKQKELQRKLYNIKSDNIEDVTKMYFCSSAMIIELGELLQTDTRWKEIVTGSPRPTKCNKEDFIKEYADVFLYLLNIAIYSGFDIEDIKSAIKNKQNLNFERLLK